jgi:hypothetical protein
VRFVVLEEDVAAAVAAAQATIDLARRVQLLLEPVGKAHQEHLEAGRPVGEVGLEQAVELEQRLVVERHQIEIGGAQSALAQAVLHGARGESGVVLLAGEPLLLGGGHELAVHQETRRAIVIERGYSQHVHRFAPTAR